MYREWKREIQWICLRFFRWITRRSIKNCEPLLIALGEAEKELQRTKNALMAAQDKLKDIERLATAAAKDSAQTLSSTNVPRGQWSFSLGQNELANKILPILGLRPHKPRKKFKVLSGWLGRL